MSAEIKFCGMTRAVDVRAAVELGAAFVGVIFAGGPRAMSAEQARPLFENTANTRRVGVFGEQSASEIAQIAERARLDVVQLHADPSPDFATEVKAATGLETWVAMRIGNAPIEKVLDRLISSADAVVFDTRAAGALGGTGQPFDWSKITYLLDQHRRAATRFILAGGLTPETAGRAIAVVRPDVVDVSSGVESAPGVKDHARMRAFAEAVRQAQ